MKKSLKILFITLLILSACVLLLTACNEGGTQQSTPSGNGGGQNIPSGNGDHVHNWGEWTTIRVPTCMVTGLDQRFCECGESEVVNTSPLGHTNVIDPAVAATCTAAGLTEGKHCSVCGFVTLDQMYTAPTGHSFGEWSIVSAPTCTENGVQERLCSCGEKETETLAANGHTDGEWVVDKNATATEDGSKHLLCSVCGKNIKDEVIPATGSLGLSYTLYQDGETYYAVITGIGTCKDSTLIIPSYIDGYRVYYIETEAFRDSPSIKNVIIGNGITSIGYMAFYTCENLESVTIPESVEGINNYAFGFCTNLKNITFAENGQLMSIGSKAFWGCSALEKIDIPDSVITLNSQAFAGCTSLTSVTIGKGVTNIGSSLFSGCTALKSIVIPDNVTKIGDRMFWNCENLVSVTLPNTVLKRWHSAAAQALRPLLYPTR